MSITYQEEWDLDTPSMKIEEINDAEIEEERLKISEIEDVMPDSKLKHKKIDKKTTNFEDKLFKCTLNSNMNKHSSDKLFWKYPKTLLQNETKRKMLSEGETYNVDVDKTLAKEKWNGENECFVKEDEKLNGEEEESFVDEGKKPFLCEHCGRCYKKSNSLRRHMQIHMPKRYECKVCNKNLTHPNRLARHMRIHSDTRQQCHVCGKLFSHNGALQKHLLIHGEKNLQCIECHKMFSHKTYLDVHMNVHTGEKRYKCDLCEKRFAQKSQLNVHMIKHTGIKKYKCDICGNQFTQRTSLKHHMSVHTNERFPCEICKKLFKNKSTLNSHLFIHNGKIFPCKKCGKEFKHRGSLYSHMCAEEGCEDDTDFDIDVQNLLCGECGETYHSLKELSYHMTVHDVEPQEFMKNVNKSLHTNDILQYRVKKHPKGVACEKCGTLFTQKSALNTHMKASHGSGKEFKCPHCEKEFARKSYLDSHIIKHTGQKDYKCNVCNKEFTQKSSLNSHMNLHTERYKCAECDKSFGRCSDFLKHKKEVHFLKVGLLEPFTTISHEVIKEEIECKMVEIDEMMDLIE